MNRVIIRIAIFCATVFLGVVLTYSLWMMLPKFTSLGAGSMVMCDGQGFGGFSVYKSYDGEDLTFSHIRFESTQSARQCFLSGFNDVEVTDREILFKRDSEIISGERIVGFSRENQYSVITAIDDNEIIAIASTSLRHALSFEEKSA